MMQKWLPVALWAGLIFFLSSIPDLRSEFPTIWDLILRKLGHMAEFGILARLAWRARPNRVWAGAFALFYAMTDEFHQRFVPGRNGTLLDVLIDATGILIALTALSPLRRFWRISLARARQNTPASSDQARCPIFAARASGAHRTYRSDAPPR